MNEELEVYEEGNGPMDSQEAALIAPYRIPDGLTGLELARFFAYRLGCAVQYKDDVVQGDGPKRELYKWKRAQGPDFTLVLGESDISFYREFAVIEAGAEYEDYFIWKKDFQEGGAKLEFYNRYALDDLRSLGIKELYCIKVELVPHHALSTYKTWEQIEGQLESGEDYFVISLKQDSPNPNGLLE